MSHGTRGFRVLWSSEHLFALIAPLIGPINGSRRSKGEARKVAGEPNDYPESKVYEQTNKRSNWHLVQAKMDGFPLECTVDRGVVFANAQRVHKCFLQWQQVRR